MASAAPLASTETCGICAYADAEGWWGPTHRGTHCRGCHRSWTGLAEAHCPVCHRHFGSNSAADRHRTRVGGCLNPAEVRHRDGTTVFRRTERASGSVWVTDGRRRRQWWPT